MNEESQVCNERIEPTCCCLQKQLSDLKAQVQALTEERDNLQKTLSEPPIVVMQSQAVMLQEIERLRAKLAAYKKRRCGNCGNYGTDEDHHEICYERNVYTYKDFGCRFWKTMDGRFKSSLKEKK